MKYKINFRIIIILKCYCQLSQLLNTARYVHTKYLPTNCK